MKRSIRCVTLCVLLLALIPVQAQQAYRLYLPAITVSADTCGDRIEQMGYWSFIRPTATQNLLLNPSFEEDVTTDWANYSTGAAGGNRTYFGVGKFGAHSLYLEKTAGALADRWGQSSDAGVTSTLGTDYIVSAWIYLDSAATIYLELDKLVGIGAGQTEQVVFTAPANEWVRISTGALTANATGDTLRVFVWIEGTPNVSAFFDAIQLEAQSATTTYCDGDQSGCEWLGAEHGSMASRGASSRAGGVLVDFDDMNFDIQGMIGAGMSPISLNVDSYAILPGGELNSQKTNVRSLSLTGWIKGTSLSDLHAKRQAIIDAVKPNAVPGDQPVVLRYTGSAIDKEISGYYTAGLEGRIRGDFVCLEQNFALRFTATDPDFVEVGQSSILLDSNDADANRRNVAGRLRSTGQWDTLGPPNVAGTYSRVHDIVVAPDRSVYFSGTFSNFDNIAAADLIVQYNRGTGAWASIGAASLGAGAVYSMAFAPNGDLYVVGIFLNAGGVAAADYIAYWDGAAWNAVGVPVAGAAAITSVRDLAFDSTGNLYITGQFTTFANVANADYIAMWDGAAWNAVGNPTAGAAAITRCDPIAIDSQDNVYVGGIFTTFADIAGADYIAMWDGAAWNLVLQLSNQVDSLAVRNDDTVFLGGTFLNAGGILNADRIASWNGISITSLSTGLDGPAYRLRFAPDGLLYAAGPFATAGGIAVKGVATWNGASWAHLDFDINSTVTAVALDNDPDPSVPANYNVWIGTINAGTLDYAGITTGTNGGTEEAYPQIKVRRTGGTSAILYSIRNETTGKVLLFAYSLLDGEELIIDLAPTQKSIASSFWGSRPDALLPNCDFGEWALQPGSNDVSAFVDIAGAPGLAIEMIWRDPYWSQD